MRVLRQRLRIAALAVTLTCTAAALVAGTAAVGSTTRSYTYVAAGGTYVAGPDLAAKVVGDQTGVRTAPLGTVTFVAPDDRFTFRVTDRNRLADAAVTIVSADGFHSNVCAGRGRLVTVTGVPPGKWVSVSIWDAAAQRTSCPTNLATTGTITVTP